METDVFSINEICEKAIAIGKEISSIDLDYSVNSLRNLETIIQSVRSLNAKGMLNDVTCWNAAVCLGVYLGEVMLRDHLRSMGYTWRADDSGLLMLMDRENRNAISPISKVHKKLANTGSESDGEGTVSSFYSVSLMLAAVGGEDKISKRLDISTVR